MRRGWRRGAEPGSGREANRTVPAFLKNPGKMLSLKLRFQTCFKLSQKDFALLEELIAVSSTAGTGISPSSEATHEKNQIKKALGRNKVTSENYFKACVSNKSTTDLRQRFKLQHPPQQSQDFIRKKKSGGKKKIPSSCKAEGATHPRARPHSPGCSPAQGQARGKPLSMGTLSPIPPASSRPVPAPRGLQVPVEVKAVLSHLGNRRGRRGR